MDKPVPILGLNFSCIFYLVNDPLLIILTLIYSSQWMFHMINFLYLERFRVTGKPEGVSFIANSPTQVSCLHSSSSLEREPIREIIVLFACPQWCLLEYLIEEKRKKKTSVVYWQTVFPTVSCPANESCHAEGPLEILCLLKTKSYSIFCTAEAILQGWVFL